MISNGCHRKIKTNKSHFPGLGTGINAAVILKDLLLANDYCLNAKLRTQALGKHVLSLVGK